jgi:Tol biopolymer transport system component
MSQFTGNSIPEIETESVNHVYAARCAGGRVLPESVVRMRVPSGFFTHPEVSPDGKRVAFWGICGGEWNIWLADAESGRAENLTAGNGTSCHPAWSPDGKQIAFSHSPVPASGNEAYGNPWPGAEFRPKRDIWILDIETGNRRQLTWFGHDAERPAWSPDGKRIACVVSENVHLDGTVMKNIYTLDTAAGLSEVVTRSEGSCYRPAWHPSGRKLAYNTKGAGSHHIWVIDVDGNNQLQVTGSVDKAETAAVIHDHGSWWSADGNRIFFHSDRGGEWGLWAVDTESGALVHIPVPGCRRPSHVTWDRLEQVLSFDMPGEAEFD